MINTKNNLLKKILEREKAEYDINSGNFCLLKLNVFINLCSIQPNEEYITIKKPGSTQNRGLLFILFIQGTILKR